MAAAADDEVIVQGDADRCRGSRMLGHRDIGVGWGRVARGMVVHQDDRRGVQFERALHHLARIDRRVVDRAALLALMGDQRVLAVEEEKVELPELCRCLTIGPFYTTYCPCTS